MSSEQPQGDPEISSLLSTHRTWLRSVIVARLGSSDGADDVLQEVSVAAIEQKSPLRQSGAVRAWLFQLAVRQSLLFRRRMGRYRKLIGRAAGRAAEEDTEGPLNWLMSLERRELVQTALNSLRGGDRELLVLKYVEAWSYRQIAEHRGSTERAIESRVHRARAHLRDLLKQMQVVELKDEVNDD